MVQYAALFIIILAVMAAMNGFLFLMLKGLAKQLKEQLGACFIRQMEFIDAIYEEKAQRLERLKEEEEMYLGRASASPLKEQLQVKKQAPDVCKAPAAAQAAAGSITREAGYINKDLIRDYRYIKEHFRVDPDQALDDVMNVQADEQMVHHGDICRHMFEILNFDVVYRIGLLPVEEQHDILYEIFDDEEDEVLRNYVAEHPDFLIVEFRDYLRIEAELNQDRIVVKAADEKFREKHPQMDVQVDESLGEGIKVFRGSRMYDYSV